MLLVDLSIKTVRVEDYVGQPVQADQPPKASPNLGAKNHTLA